jgi:hydroxyacylglutathione hydrolase
VDVRSKEAFAAAHIPGAVSIPFGPMLPTWAGWVLPYDRPLLVVTDGPGQAAAVATHLFRVGFDALGGCLDGGMDAWEMAGLPLASLTMVPAPELERQLRKNRNNMTVLDVRTDGEWASGHIEGAQHIPVGNVLARLAEVPRGKPLAVVCGSGYRGSIAGSLLQREGFENVSNLVGGMHAWNSAGLPVTIL